MITAPLTMTDQDARSISSVKNGPELGQLAQTSDGRIYRYAKAGASNLAAGKLTVNADLDTDVVNKTIAATYSSGVQTVSINAAGAVSADYAAGGYLTVNDDTGEGISYLVNSNTVTSGAAASTIQLAEPTMTALTISVSEGTLTPHPYDGVVISATDQADMPTGVPNVSVTAAYYHWEQTGGICSVLYDEAVTRGQALTIGTGTAGAVEALDAAGEPQLGVAFMAGVDTEYQPAYLTIY